MSVNPTEFGRIAFKYFPNEANQLMINANISITDYFSLIESYPALGNAYLSNLKNTLMNMGYTAAGWTYLADEHHIYGSSRVGVHNTNFVLAKRFSTAEMEYTQKTGNQVHFIRGKRNYELSNHLGNVQVVITDKRISVCDNELQTERFEADILMATDYYPFGMAIPERQWYTGSDSSNYRYGFNTQEKDYEISGPGNSMTAEFWQYDTRLGRRWNLDPVINFDISLYSVFLNSPISYSDHLGNVPEASNGTQKGNKNPQKLKLRFQILRINPFWWGKKGKARMLEWLRCHRSDINVYREKKNNNKFSINLIRVVDKEEVRMVSMKIDIDEKNGLPSDQIIDTRGGGQIVIQSFDDKRITDQLIIEDGSGGNGIGTDPTNSNTTNDLYASSSGPDGTTPAIINRNIRVSSGITRIRVIPNVNGTNQGTTVYEGEISFQWKEKRSKHREYLLGFIPLFWKNETSGWNRTKFNSKAKNKSKWE